MPAASCPFHGDCLQGLASGKAMQQRWSCRADELPHDHPGLEIEATYLARALLMYHYTLSPERILLGGGVNGGPARPLPPQSANASSPNSPATSRPTSTWTPSSAPPPSATVPVPLGAVRLARLASGNGQDGRKADTLRASR